MPTLLQSDIKSFVDKNLKTNLSGDLYMHLAISLYEASGQADADVVSAIREKLPKSLPEISPELLDGLKADIAKTVSICLDCFAHDLMTKSEPYMNPPSLSELCIALANPQPGEKVYLPFAGMAEDAAQLPSGVNAFGEELDSLTWALGKINLWARGKEGMSLAAGDTLKTIEGLEKDSLDVVVMTPPMSIARNRKTFLQTFQRLLDAVRTGGRIVAVLTSSSSLSKEFFNTALPHVRTVISLPNVLWPFTGIVHQLFVFEKNASNRTDMDDTVTMMDAKDYIVKQNGHRSAAAIKTAELLAELKNGGDSVRNLAKGELMPPSLLPSVYVLPKSQSSFPEVRLDTLIDVITLDDVREGWLKTAPPLAGLRSLSNDYKNCLLEGKLEPNTLTRYEVLSEDALIFERRYMKVGHFLKSDETPAIAFNRQSVFAFKLKKGKENIIEQDYLLKMLCGEYVMSQLSGQGSVVRRLELREFLRLAIVLPPIDVQRQSLKDDKNRVIAELRELEAANELANRKNLSSLRHYLSGTQAALKAQIKALNSFRLRNGGVLHDEDIVSRNSGITVADMFERIMATSEIISQTIVRLRGEWRETAPEKIRVNDYLEKFAKATYPGLVRFSENLDDPDTSIIFSRSALDKICENICTNAYRHGFGEKIIEGRDQVRISWTLEGNAVHVVLANNGQPLSITSEKVFELGEKSDGSRGEGIGGYDIFELMRQGGGEARIVSSPDEEFPVKYILTFNTICHD